ncbi:hypothetical protein ES708_22912 [subsurface metagenome]
MKRLLGLIYYYNEDLKKSLHTFLSISQFIERKRKEQENYIIGNDDFPWFDYFEVIQYISIIYYKTGEYDKAITYANYVIGNLPELFDENGESAEDDVLFGIDSFIIRMNINMHNDDFKKVIADYEKVKGYLDWEYWETGYADIVKYIEEKTVA